MKNNLRQAFLLQSLGQRQALCPICNKKYKQWSDGHINATCGSKKCIKSWVEGGKCSSKSYEYRKYMENCAEKGSDEH